MRAAASSMARGSPSKRAQIWATVRALALVNWKPGWMAWARWRKRFTQGSISGFPQPKRLGNGGDDQVRIAERGQGDEADALGKVLQ